MKPSTKFKKSIANYLKVSDENIFLFWKGRVALYAILKAIGIKKDDEVIIPAFTCVVVPNAIIYLGAKPVYVDIDSETYNIDVNKIEEKITQHTRVIMAQNTFGLSPDMDAIFSIAKKHNLYVIEDCTHGFGGTYKGKLNGTLADASFFSTQWNKPFSTGIGGFALIKDADIANNITRMKRQIVKPSAKDEITLKILLRAQKHLLNPTTYWMIQDTYRFLSKKNLIIGSSQGQETETTKMQKGFFKGMSETQAKSGVTEISKVNDYIAHRKSVANEYNYVLISLEKKIPFVPNYAEHTFLKYPVLVSDRKKFFSEAEKNKIETSDWFLSPIHPITDNFEQWFYSFGENQVAEKISQNIVNLPTHEKIKKQHFEKLILFLKKNSYLIE